MTLGASPRFIVCSVMSMALSSFLGERVICQRSPHNQLLTPAFPPFTMRRHATTPVGEREALVEGIQYHFFVMDMPYQVFATTYLLDEVPSVYSSGYI